jgi:hypothetical protein
MTLTLNHAFDAALAGTLTQGDLLKMFCRVNETSKEVRTTFDAMDKRDRELTTEEIDSAYTMGNASIYADHAKGYTLD